MIASHFRDLHKSRQDDRLGDQGRRVLAFIRLREVSRLGAYIATEKNRHMNPYEFFDTGAS